MPIRTRTWRVGAAIAAIAVSTALVSGCAANSEPADTATPAAKTTTPLSVALGFLPNAEYAGNFVADDAGYYAQAGIKPTFVPGGPNAPAPEVQLASGQAQIAYENNTSRLFNYLAKADDVVAVGRVFQVAPNGLLSLSSHPVRTPAQLKGSRVIAAAMNRSSIDALMKLNDVSDYTFVPGGADIGALQGGQGDALLSFASNQPVAMEQQGLKEGKDFYFTPFSKLNYYLLADVILVSKTFLSEHRDVVIDYLKASAKGWDKAIADPKAAAELTVSKYATDQGLNPEQQESVLKAQIPYMKNADTKKNGLFWLDPSFIENKVYPSLKAAGITDLPEVSKVLDTSVQAAAQK